MKSIIGVILLCLACSGTAYAATWEHEGDQYYLAKESRDSFSGIGAGGNKVTQKYLSYEGIDFLMRGENTWRDYGRIDLEGNKSFTVPIRPGMTIGALHLLAGGNFGNSYEHDRLLRLYKDNYYYGVINLVFVYADGTVLTRSVPVFWDWLQLNNLEWKQDGARIKNVGANPVRKDCSMYHISFENPRPTAPLTAVVLMDSWLSDRPFSDVFSLTITSTDSMDALPKKQKSYPVPLLSAQEKQPDTRTAWSFDQGLDGWVAGCSDNWSSDAYWKEACFGKAGAAVLPASAVGKDKHSWIENKITLPKKGASILQFTRHSAVKSEFANTWTDGVLKVIIKERSVEKVLYEKLYSGEWTTETVDLSRYKGATVLIRFENHGAGTVKLSETTSPVGDGEDAILADVKLIGT